MCNKEELNSKVYEPIRSIKQRFYESKDEQQWQSIKEELVEVLAKAESMMDSTFYATYKEGVIASIKKMYDAKQAYFNKAKEKKTYPVKSSYIFREEEGKAFIELCNAMSNYLNLKCNG